MSGRIIAFITLFLFFSGLFLTLSRLSFQMRAPEAPTLIVSFRSATTGQQVCRKATPEELSKMLAHMRREEICERTRQSIHMKVEIDGVARTDKAYEALGYSSDGITVAFENLAVITGTHTVRVQIVEGSGENIKSFEFKRAVHFLEGRRYLIDFNKDKGFVFYGD